MPFEERDQVPLTHDPSAPSLSTDVSLGCSDSTQETADWGPMGQNPLHSVTRRQDNYLLSAWNIPDTCLGTGNTAMKKKKRKTLKVPALEGLLF